MYNWCKNEIVINGDKSKIKEILERLGTIPDNNKSIVFETLIGTDPDLLKLGRKESNIKRFGTFLDVSPEDCNIQFSDDIITMSPKTAGSPPVPLCITVAQDYGVRVTNKYAEPNGDFAGICIINEYGEIESEIDYDYYEGTKILNL